MITAEHARAMNEQAPPIHAQMKRAATIPEHRHHVRRVLDTQLFARLVIAYGGFRLAECAAWVAVAAYAYEHGGATGAAVAGAVQLAPASVAALTIGRLVARSGAGHTLFAGYAIQSLSLGATAVAFALGASLPIVYGCAATAACAVTSTRPCQGALYPRVFGTGQALVAANVVTGWMNAAGTLAGPVAAAVILELSDLRTLFIFLTAVTTGCAILVRPVTAFDAERPLLVAGQRDSSARAGLRLLRHPGPHRRLLALTSLHAFAVGAIDVLFVLVSVELLGLHASAAGWMEVAVGVGIVIGAFAAAGLVRDNRQCRTLVVTASTVVLAFMLLGVSHVIAGSAGLLGLIGAGGALIEVILRTLLQRLIPAIDLGDALALAESAQMAMLGLGSATVACLVAFGGASAGPIGIGLVLGTALLLGWNRITSLDNADGVNASDHPPSAPNATASVLHSVSKEDFHEGTTHRSAGGRGHRPRHPHRAGVDRPEATVGILGSDAPHPDRGGLGGHDGRSPHSDPARACAGA